MKYCHRCKTKHPTIALPHRTIILCPTIGAAVQDALKTLADYLETMFPDIGNGEIPELKLYRNGGGTLVLFYADCAFGWTNPYDFVDAVKHAAGAYRKLPQIEEPTDGCDVTGGQ